MNNKVTAQDIVNIANDAHTCRQLINQNIDHTQDNALKLQRLEDKIDLINLKYDLDHKETTSNFILRLILDVLLIVLGCMIANFLLYW